MRSPTPCVQLFLCIEGILNAAFSHICIIPMLHSSLSPRRTSLKSQIKVVFAKEWKESMGFVLVWFFLPKSFISWELYHGLGSSNTSILGQNMWSLWYMFMCFACSPGTRVQGVACGWHEILVFFLGHTGSGELGLCCWYIQPIFWCCLLGLEPELEKGKPSFVVHVWYCQITCLNACKNKLYSTETVWQLLTELPQPCLCWKQWYTWVSFSLDVLIWMLACLSACLVWIYCLSTKYIRLVNWFLCLLTP